MRVLFCGSGEFAIPSLRAILTSSHELVGVVTQPARPAGRSGKPRPTPLSSAAASAGLQPYEWADMNADDALASLRPLRADVMVVADFGQLIRRSARETASTAAFNLHASILPHLRGAAPVNWAIIRGCAETGVTTFELADRMDAGPVYLTASTDIWPDETAEELRRRLAELGAGLVVRTLELLAAGNAGAKEQDHSLATLAPRLKKADGLIRWSEDAVTVRNLIHGTWPWPGGQTVFRKSDGRQTSVTIARAAAEDAPAGGSPGELGADLSVATGRGRLRILEIQPADRRLMSWRDFVNGHHAAAGDRFVTPGL